MSSKKGPCRGCNLNKRLDALETASGIRDRRICDIEDELSRLGELVQRLDQPHRERPARKWLRKRKEETADD